MKFIPKPKISIPVVLAICLLIGGYQTRKASSGAYCVNCHEIRPSHDQWAQSAHRNMPCTECHGTLLSSGWHSLWENSKRAFSHVRWSRDERIGLNEEQVVRMMFRCQQCHRQQYADWSSSGHSLGYGDVFLNPVHNKVEQINEDCLRCHGMFFEGNVADLVTPLETKGPWRLLRTDLARRPVIPCLTCHKIHTRGVPADSPDYSAPAQIASKRVPQERPVGFYDRREKMFVDLERLPMPSIHMGRKKIDVAADPHMKICYQCHAPAATHEAGTSDDRTLRGVHAGLSCAVCHATHSLDAREACANCHPQLSNCNLDVTKMETTYASAASRHNLHFVGCTDCHVKGVPKKKGI